MSSVTARDQQAGGAPSPGRPEQFDWRAIECSPEFQELVRSRRRFIVPAAAFFFSFILAYFLLAAFAEDFMAEQIVDGLPVAWVLAASQVVMTWAVTWLYLRKADREWEPLERRAAERAAAAVAAADGGADGRGPRAEASLR
jgi:uncharacterized membrane protein (DUF485 family)